MKTMLEVEKNTEVNKSVAILLDKFDREVISVPDLLKMKVVKSRPIFGLGRKIEPSAEAICSLLLNDKITKSSPEELEGVIRPLVDRVRTFVNESRPIELCLIAFSPRSHSPVETGMRRLPDLGEMMFIKRLQDIDATIRQLHSPGVHFTVLFEGNAFVNRFGNFPDEVTAFRQNLHLRIEQMGAGAKVELADLAEVTGSFPSFEEVRQEQEAVIRQGLQDNRNIRQEVETFMPVMRRASVDLSGQDFEDLVEIMRHKGHAVALLSGRQGALAAAIEQQAQENAIFYVSFNKARHSLKIVENTFPDKIYISITAKPGRLAIHPVHSNVEVLPHHGVPVINLNGFADIIHFHKLISRRGDFGPKLSRVHFEGDLDEQPFFFREVKPKREESGHTLGCYGVYY